MRILSQLIALCAVAALAACSIDTAIFREPVCSLLEAPAHGTIAAPQTEVGSTASMYKQLVADGAREPTMLARREDGDAVLCSDFRVLSLRTGELIASASEDDEASFDRAAGAPLMAVPTETELRAWAAELIARPPRVREVETVVAWVPDGLADVVEQALAPGRFILLGAKPGTGGAWLRFYREP